jgi:hypothetical protein
LIKAARFACLQPVAVVDSAALEVGLLGLHGLTVRAAVEIVGELELPIETR